MLSELLLFAAIALILFAFYKWATLNNDFFEKRNIKFIKPHFLAGNTGALYLRRYAAADFNQKLYQAFPDESIVGHFDLRMPQYICRDIEAIKQITIKDFDHFDHRLKLIDEDTDQLFGNMLMMMKGEKWRHMRATLSPAFTGSKMRQMFELVTQCVNGVVEHFLKRIESGEKVNIEMKDFFSRYTNDVIASCAFGLKNNSFNDPNNEFYVNAVTMVNLTGITTMLKMFFSKLPAVARALRISFIDAPIAKSFTSTILDTMEIRKKNNIHRPDMINIMMQIREGTFKYQPSEKNEEKEGYATFEEPEMAKLSTNRAWNDVEIVSQCFTFYLAGFETSSTSLSFLSYELTVNPRIQQKLYEEIVEVEKQLNGKSVTYDALQKMNYMDQVVCETLRKWPPVVESNRVCIKDYEYIDGNNFKYRIDKGTSVIFPIYGIHHDSKYFPEPEKFDPERFSDENKINIIPGTYLPFGMGPRGCIASRFALMEIKAIVYYLVLNFSFEPNEKTQIPVKLRNSVFSLVPEKGIHLELKRRSRSHVKSVVKNEK